MESRVGWVRDTVFYPCDQEYLNHGPGQVQRKKVVALIIGKKPEGRQGQCSQGKCESCGSVSLGA